MTRVWQTLPILWLAALSGVAWAQGQRQPPRLPVTVEIPRGLRPPQGMCRIWVDNVPANQQPAPTDCPTAIRNRPPNGRVIFSDEAKAEAKAREKQPPRDPGGGKKPRKPPGDEP